MQSFDDLAEAQEYICELLIQDADNAAQIQELEMRIQSLEGVIQDTVYNLEKAL